jgi:hypothetical protein
MLNSVLQGVRDRTRHHLSITLSDLDSMTIALASGSVDATALVEYLHDGVVQYDALAAMMDLALSDVDFTSLYARSGPNADGTTTHAPHNARIAEHEACAEARDLRKLLEDALVTTLKEDAQGKLWRSSATTRVAASIALFRTSDAQGCLSAVIGGMVPTDARRIDDLKTCIEDNGVDVMMLCQAMRALAAVVT